jgi:hypothetical protein
MKIKMKVPALMVLVLISLLACKKQSRDDNAVADVYVKCILVDGQPEYALAHYLLGYSSISAVTVTSPDATTTQLSSYDNSFTLFYSEPSLASGSYSLTMPTEGTYSYKVRFDDGIEKTYTDQVSGTFLLPPTITSLAKTDDNARVKLNWAPLPDAEYYRFFISKDGSTIYASNLFTPISSDNTIEVPLTVIPSYASGTYTFELVAFKYQSLSEGKIQSASSASADINL